MASVSPEGLVQPAAAAADLGFLDGAAVLLTTYPALGAALFAALCVMAQCRPSALLEPHLSSEPPAWSG